MPCGKRRLRSFCSLGASSRRADIAFLSPTKGRVPRTKPALTRENAAGGAGSLNEDGEGEDQTAIPGAIGQRLALAAMFRRILNCFLGPT
jgi:hypothetical protein